VTRLKILYAATVLCLLSVLLPAQTKPAQDGWEPFRFFAGEWEGTGARETYKLLSADDLIESFELAEQRSILKSTPRIVIGVRNRSSVNADTITRVFA
jgi:hypothetical protein